MNSNLTPSLLPVVVKAINDYGVDVNVYRDIYENELGVKTLKEQGVLIASIKAVIDNSKSTAAINNNFRVEGIIHPQHSATIYYAYSDDLDIQREDYILIDGICYILDTPDDILHYNVLYKVSAEVTIQ